MRDKQRDAPPRVWQLFVNVFGDDADPARCRSRDVVDVAFARAGVDDMALDIPRTAEGRGRQPRGGAAAEAHAHGDLAPNPALHVQPWEGVLMAVQEVCPL